MLRFEFERAQRLAEFAKRVPRILLGLTVVTVLVALGSNLGASEAIVKRAIQRLRAFAHADFRASSLWRTGPVDCPPGADDYINAVVAFRPRTGLTPETLLSALKAIEREFGRQPTSVRNAPRELDLDLLVFDDQVRDGDDFTLPHPRGHQRRFVLAPAAEVAADLVWPGRQRTIAQLLASLADVERVTRLPESPC